MNRAEVLLVAAERAAPVFLSEGWTWIDKVPDVDEIIETLDVLVSYLEEDPEVASSSTGRFHVGRDEGNIYIRLELGVLWANNT